tara:strand:- start:1387 stop:1866 length:480 start_codon:yes stop_codon:yes gene_type:complete
MESAKTSGATATDLKADVGKPDMKVWQICPSLDFANGSDSYAQFQVAFPEEWDEGVVTFQAFWSVAAVVTTGVAIALQGVSVPDGSTIDGYGTAVVVTDNAISSTESSFVTDESEALTIASAGAGSITHFQAFRDVSDGNDDMTQDLKLLGIKVFYTEV